MQFARSTPWCLFLAIALLLTSRALSQTENEVSISVSGGTIPTFSWIPDSAIGLLVVKERSEHLWDTEAKGLNIYRSPILYGVHPSESAYDKPAIPLIAGHTYTVSLYRFVSASRHEFQLLGEKEFSPSVESQEEVKPPVIVSKQEEETPAVGVTQEKEAPVADAKQEDEEPDAGVRRALRVGALSADFKFDGMVNEPAWGAATDSIANLITTEPEEGGVPAGRTIVKVLADQNEIVVGVRCYDNEPAGIVSYSKARDSEIEGEDHILIVFDTFLDGRFGYVFAVNPEGARFDGLVIDQGKDVKREWDAIWEAKTSRDDSGWSAEIRIPIKSLNFKKDLTTWGFNVQRRVQRLQETSRWSGASVDYDLYQMNHAGLLTDLPKFDFGVGMSIRTAIVARAGTPAPSDNDDISIDVTQKLGPNFLSALTINTDFAETEVDVRQINVTRFPLFFPEKRTFFLEGADIFEFAFGLDEDKLVPFFTRRIGLHGISEEVQSEIPINVGAKINGRVDDTNLGALVVNTRKVDSLDLGTSKLHMRQTTMGALRIKQNILEESSLGMLANFGDQQGRSGSYSAGVDFIYRTSRFLGDKNLVISAWGMLNDRQDLHGDKSAFGFKTDYRTDLLSINVNTIRLGDGFDPSLGFVPRNNIHFWEFSVEYKPRPGWELVRQMFHDVTLTLFNNRNNSRRESYNILVKPFDWLLESGDRFEGRVERQGDRPPEAFEVSANVDIPPSSYEWTRYTLRARSAEKRIISGQVTWAFGDYYNGNLKTVAARLELKPSAFITLEVTGQRSSGKVMALPDEIVEDEPIVLVQKRFTEELYGFRFQLNFSSDLQFSSLTQYDTQSKELGSNNKLRWTFDPLGDLFVVYNHMLVRKGGRWTFLSNQLPIKVQYAWRF